MIFCCPAAFLFFFVILLSTVLIVSAGDVLFLWLALELGSLGFIGFVSTNDLKEASAEAVVKYYLPSASSSMLFFFLVLVGSGTGSELFQKLAVVPLLVKLGVAPGHFWVPMTVQKLEWFPAVVLLSFQKLGPLHAITWGAPFSPGWVWVGVGSAFLGGIGGMNQVSFNKVVAYSSISSMGWLLSVSMVDSWVPYVGWGLYSMTVCGLMMSFPEGGKSFVYGKNFGLLMFIVLMAGWPGGSMFTLKWLVLSKLMVSGAIVPSVVLSLSSAAGVPMYLSLVFSSVLHYHWRLEKSWASPRWLAVFLGGSYFWVGTFV